MDPERDMPAHKAAEISSRTPEVIAGHRTKPFGWDVHPWVQWTTAQQVLNALEIPPGARFLDVGCGVGWTTLFLGESGFEAHGVDLVPANVEASRERAERWESAVTFEVADMDRLDLGERRFDAALVLDALHHSTSEAEVIRGVARHLEPGGWLILCEPTWIHGVSPHARDARALGWKERGIRMRRLRSECRDAGLGDFRRFHQGTDPYERRWRSLAWQAARLVGAHVAVAPASEHWLAARKPG